MISRLLVLVLLFIALSVFYQDVDSVKFTRQPFVIICPDLNYCQNTSTCCETPYKNYGCCPLEEAVCCLHTGICCPHGFDCTNDPPYCLNARSRREVDLTAHEDSLQALTEVVLEVNKRATVVGNDTVTCELDSSGSCASGEKCCYDYAPDGNSSSNSTTKFAACCPSSATCCNDQETGYYYGFCPLTDAVCCSDKKHCCPNGYTCSTTDSGCVWNAHADRFVHQLVTAPLGRVASQALDLHPGSDSNFSLNLRAKRNVHSNSTKDDPYPCHHSDPTVYCKDGYTCCPVNDGKFMCCPLAHAVCCSDHKTCCPQDTTCDTTNHICTK